MLEMIRQQRVDGIIFITHYDHGDISSDLPIVSVDRHIGAGFPYVTSDNYAMSKKAVEELLRKGARNIGCVCGATAVESETKYRYLAYTDVMKAHNLPVRLMLKQFKHGQEMQVLREYFKEYPETDGILRAATCWLRRLIMWRAKSDCACRKIYRLSVLTAFWTPGNRIRG